MRVWYSVECMQTGKGRRDMIDRTQKKENYYYVFWTVAMIAFIVPQVFTAYAYMSIKDLLDKPIQVEYINNDAV